MYQVGDYLMYGGHGMCKIDEVTIKTFSGKEKMYYVLHPVDHPDLTLFFPVDGDVSKLKRMVSEDEARKLLEVFKKPAKAWIEKTTERNQRFNAIVQGENRKEIAELMNTLMRRKIELEKEGKKLAMQETKLLQQVSNIVFNELAYSLSTTTENIEEKINNMVLKTSK